jgi:hypothetical protein
MKFEFFTAIDLVSIMGWLLIFIAGAHIIYAKNRAKPEFKYYLAHFYWKLTASIIFALIYIFVYDGGDTMAYWQGALKLNKVFYDSPSNYFTELFKTPMENQFASYFTPKIGRPPVWIYREPNSWFVCKVASIFSFFSFGSFITLNLFFSIISGWISWRFFRLMNEITTIQTKYLALAFLFIPSVGFWCSGLSKDTIVLCAIYGTVSVFFYFIYKTKRVTLYLLLQIMFFSYLLYAVRPFVLITVFFPISIMIVFLLNKHKPFITKIITRLAGSALVLGLFFVYLNNSNLFGEFSANNIVETAEIIHSDFQNNETYKGKKYDLGITDFSPVSLISVIPAAIVTTLFRPFIWEAGNVLMILNGLESLLLLYFCAKMILTVQKGIPIKVLFTQEYFIFSIIYVLILAYFVGFTSGLFGILARLKAPVLPFFVFILLYKLTKDKTSDNQVSEREKNI